MLVYSCRHCGRRPARCRRLCNICYRNNSIRDLYPHIIDSREKPDPDDSRIPIDLGGRMCLWCGSRVNEEYLRKCKDCEIEYQERLAAARLKHPEFDRLFDTPNGGNKFASGNVSTHLCPCNGLIVATSNKLRRHGTRNIRERYARAVA